MGTAMVSINPEDGEKVILKFKGESAYKHHHKPQKLEASSANTTTIIKPIDSLFSSSNLKQLEKKSHSKKHFDRKKIKHCFYQDDI